MVLFGESWLVDQQQACTSSETSYHSIFHLRRLVQVLVAGFVTAGGIKGFDPLHLTDQVISVDEPVKYIIYYMGLFILFGLSIWVGKRWACHSICWMSPFLTAGTWLGKKLHIPQLRIKANQTACIDCKKCNQKCPMSIGVNPEVKSGGVHSMDCILCGECVDNCLKNVLGISG